MRAAATSAPKPANAICPSDSWPAQPVRTVSESPQSAKQQIVAYSRWREGAVMSRGRTIANTSSAPRTRTLNRRTHQIPRSCSGISRTFGANEKVWVSAGPRPRLWRATAMRTATKRRPSIKPGLSR